MQRWLAAAQAALRPSSARLATVPALWAALIAGLVAIAGSHLGHLETVGLIYFGAACAAVFVTNGVYRTRALALTGQGLGAVAGFAAGTLAGETAVAKVGVAVLVALVAGMIGAIGRLVTAFALMAVVGAAFTEFGGVPLPWWQQAGAYLVGTALIAAVALVPWIVRPDHHERAAIAAVLDRSADLGLAIGTDRAATARAELAAAFAASREAVLDHRLLPARSSRRRRALGALRDAEAVAHEAAQHYATGAPVPADWVRRRREQAEQVRHNTFVADQTPPPTQYGPDLGERFAAAARTALTWAATLAGLRLAWCMAIATAITCGLHHDTHSFWLPLTVAVIVRPEYASVFVRSVNRGAGTVVGALIAAALIAALHSGVPVAIAAALSLGFAVLVAPRLYALCVVGVTCSALLSACIGGPDPAYPAIRALDSLLGCAIAIVFGYLLWPGRQSLPDDVRLEAATQARAAYLREAVKIPAQRADWPGVRDRAYRLAHRSRAAANRALLEPPPAGELARAALPTAIAIENDADVISALAAAVEAGQPPPPPEELERMLVSPGSLRLSGD